MLTVSHFAPRAAAWATGIKNAIRRDKRRRYITGMDFAARPAASGSSAVAALQ